MAVREPQKWTDASDVPVGVKVKPAGWMTSAPTFIRDEHGWAQVDDLGEVYARVDPCGVEPDRYLNAVWSPTGTGFVEVSSDA